MQQMIIRSKAREFAFSIEGYEFPNQKPQDKNFDHDVNWLMVSIKYTDKDIIRCGAAVAAANILQLLCPLVILIKFPIEYSLIKKREPRTSFFIALLLELLYPFYLLICLVGGLFRSKEW